MLYKYTYCVFTLHSRSTNQHKFGHQNFGHPQLGNCLSNYTATITIVHMAMASLQVIKRSACDDSSAAFQNLYDALQVHKLLSHSPHLLTQVHRYTCVTFYPILYDIYTCVYMALVCLLRVSCMTLIHHVTFLCVFFTFVTSFHTHLDMCMGVIGPSPLCDFPSIFHQQRGTSFYAEIMPFLVWLDTQVKKDT